ncbi:MAG: hypothetical protein H7210_02905, partial [Pyrinomonadaceae bacterium]|nr:hypothetical protein [Phycisphaerales bacterium]
MKGTPRQKSESPGPPALKLSRYGDDGANTSRPAGTRGGGEPGASSGPDAECGPDTGVAAGTNSQCTRMNSHEATSLWLSTFVKNLRWSGIEACSVRDELDSHVLERTRDLMLSGIAEDAAVRQALCDPRVHEIPRAFKHAGS